MATLTPIEEEIIEGMVQRRPELGGTVPAMTALHHALVKTYDADGKLLTCGNGGSHADAMHIVGELGKSFERKRPVPPSFAARLDAMARGPELAKHLEVGLAAVTLGLNGSLKTAVENDSELRDIAFAQEAYALMKPEDVLLAISTSGNADNCFMAMTVGKAVGATVVSLTGPSGGAMANLADIAIKAPGDSTKTVQENHIVLYHTLCGLIEAHYFPTPR
jgi:D-sedoheptulose 7-phosphate isomerase